MYKKKGYPKREEFVVCTVQKLLHHSVFMSLDEYDNKEGMLHASELHRKWLRNWKSMLKPGTKTVCKVVRFDEEKGHISLSIKRVGAAQHRNKLKEWKNEKTADGILTFFAKNNKVSTAQIYDKIGYELLDKYGLIFPVFLEVAKGDSKLLEELGAPKELTKKLVDFIVKRITIPKTTISGKLEINSYSNKGVEIIKQALSEGEKIADRNKVELKFSYLGAPKYKFTITADDYKVGEKVYEELQEVLTKFMKKNEGEVKFYRK